MASKQGSEPNVKGLEALKGFKSAEAPKEWATLGERFLYRPGPPDGKGGITKEPGYSVNPRTGEEQPHCGSVAIKGYLFDVYTYENEAIGRDFSMLAIMLTEPCVGIQDGQLCVVEKGQTMIVTETSDLKIYERAARHPTHTCEVWIQPKGLRSIPGSSGQTVRLWSRKADKPVLRAPLGLPSMAFFDGPDPFPALPESTAPNGSKTAQPTT